MPGAFPTAILFRVILRVTRSRVVPGHEEHVIAVLRQLTATMGSSIKGLHSASFGRAMDEHDQGMSLVSITEWESIEAIQAVYGDGWAERTILPGAESYILETTVEHFESTLDDVSEVVEQRRLAAE
jgi:heme-degrading monooxygenase HmoA